MAHILVAGEIHADGVALLARSAGITYEVVASTAARAYLPALPHADALLLRTQPLTAEDVASAPNLRIVSRHGVGYDAVDVPALTARGIPLAIVGNVNAGSVAEHTLMLMLAAAKRAVDYDDGVRRQGWDRRNGFQAVELAGRRLLILGGGRIGRHVARLSAAFDMRVSIYDPYAGQAAVEGLDAVLVTDLPSALSQADVLSVHFPRQSGRPLLDTAELALLPKGAIVVNTARGGIIDEPALANALQSGRLAAAGLDVFTDEPPAPDNPLLACPTAVLSPHSAGLTAEAASRMATVAVRNILDHLAGSLAVERVVNPLALAADVE